MGKNLKTYRLNKFQRKQIPVFKINSKNCLKVRVNIFTSVANGLIYLVHINYEILQVQRLLLVNNFQKSRHQNYYLKLNQLLH